MSRPTEDGETPGEAGQTTTKSGEENRGFTTVQTYQVKTIINMYNYIVNCFII